MRWRPSHDGDGANVGANVLPHALAAITEGDSVRRVLPHLGLPSEAPRLARARDPTDAVDDDGEAGGQLELAVYAAP